MKRTPGTQAACEVRAFEAVRIAARGMNAVTMLRFLVELAHVVERSYNERVMRKKAARRGPKPVRIFGVKTRGGG